MSRAMLTAILLLGAGFGLAAANLTAGLSDREVAEAEKVLSSLASARTQVETSKAKFTALIEKERVYFEKTPVPALGETHYGSKLKKIKSFEEDRAPKIREYIALDDGSDSGALLLAQDKLEMDITQLLYQLDMPLTEARKVLRYKTENANLVKAANDALDGPKVPKNIFESSLGADAAKAKVDYPQAAAEVDKRMKALGGQVQAFTNRASRFQTLAAQSPRDLYATGQLADVIVNEATALNSATFKLKEELGSLYYSVDRILADMKTENGLFYHKYRTVKNGSSKTEDWSLVTPTDYKKHKDHLGMTLYSKPEGVFADQATQIATPPGYTYVGNPRYGRWQNEGGRSFWVFYGQYALMRDLLWGPYRYRPVYRSSWNSYRTNRRANRSYFGPKKGFGSRGSLTKSKYKSSTYMKKSASYGNSSYRGSRSSRSRGGRFSSSSYRGFGK